MKKSLVFLLIYCLPLIVSCSTVDYNIKDEQMTVAKAQREIKVGMSSSDVIEVLGSPNMISTDDQRREVWVYDKVSTSVSSSSSNTGVWLLLFGSGSNSMKSSSTQRTLTIIIKFDNNNKVRDFAYRTSAF